MKVKSTILSALLLPLVTVNWGSFKNGAYPTQNYTPNQGDIFGGESQIILLAKIICPPRGSCYEDGRGSTQNINIISPPRGSLLNNQPMLSWSEISGATSYIVSLFRSGENLWELQNVTSREIPYPQGELPLEADYDYELVVEAGEESGKATFRLLPPAEAEKVQAEAQSIRNLQLNPDETVLKIAEIYQKNKLFTEAIEILKQAIENGSQSVKIYQMIGDLYQEAKLPNLAAPPYQKALNLATTLNDINAQAEARIGLARVNIALNNFPTSVDLLKTALANYETLKNSELVAQAKQFLGEVYERSGDPDQALHWYQQAKENYQSLKDLERIENIDRAIVRLKK